MKRTDRKHLEHSGSCAPMLAIPHRRPATEEEKARRRELFAEAERLRALLGPLGMTADELIRQVRVDTEGITESPHKNALDSSLLAECPDYRNLGS